MKADAFSPLETNPLCRHQLRREQGLPTITLLIGPPGIGLRCWRDWASRTGRRFVVLSAADESAFAVAWLNGAAAADLVKDVLAWLATISVDPGLLSRKRLERMSLHDFNQLWRSLFVDSSQNPTALIARRILTATIFGMPLPEDFRKFLAAPDHGCQPTVQAFFAGMAGLIPATRLPAILLTAPDPKPEDWFIAAAKILASIVTSIPTLPVAIVATAVDVEGGMRAAPDSRLTTLLREGRVELEGSSAQQIHSQLAKSGVTIPTETAVFLSQAGVSSDVTSILAEAAGKLTKVPDAHEEEQARSAAERFLFEILDSWPATAGQFKLNERLEFLHGSASAEGDLVAPASRLVIELDGSYHHLADPDAYRRDRRKDYSYQRHSYLVLRFLSEDVVTRIEQILRTIAEALAHQTLTHPQQRSDS